MVARIFRFSTSWTLRCVRHHFRNSLTQTPPSGPQLGAKEYAEFANILPAAASTPCRPVRYFCWVCSHGCTVLTQDPLPLSHPCFLFTVVQQLALSSYERSGKLRVAYSKFTPPLVGCTRLHMNFASLKPLLRYAVLRRSRTWYSTATFRSYIRYGKLKLVGAELEVQLSTASLRSA